MKKFFSGVIESELVSLLKELKRKIHSQVNLLTENTSVRTHGKVFGLIFQMIRI